MFNEDKVTEIYCIVDDFCKEFASQQEKYLIEEKEVLLPFDNLHLIINDKRKILNFMFTLGNLDD